jgi:hypothetical protein
MAAHRRSLLNPTFRIRGKHAEVEWFHSLGFGGKHETIHLDGIDLFDRADSCTGAGPGGESGLGKVAADPRQLLKKSGRHCRRDASREVQLPSDSGTDDVRKIDRSRRRGEQLRVREGFRRAGAQTSKLNETDKDKLVAELKASMDICKQAFSKLTDSTLGDLVPWFGGRQVPRVSAALEVTNDLIDHYAALAVYLRLNGLLPPTAQRK